MGSGAGSYGHHEIGDTKSSAQMDEHKKTLQKFIDQGYKVESQEEKDEKGLGGELVWQGLVTVLVPPSSQMPQIKMDAREVFGHYNYQDEAFVEYDNPRFEVKAYTKGNSLSDFNEDWAPFDIA
ncbi:hypothetical protein GF340_05085 [Candidatus Peregrinibacteria bacterium]|nr:hypothetical protein [Candidatus Peregrinibacteria bacterium]